jgi:hypothetical protein
MNPMPLEADCDVITKNPDAGLLRFIEKYHALADEAQQLDNDAMEAERRVGGSSTATELHRRHDRIFDQACSLQWELVYKEPKTVEGHRAKVAMVQSSSFDIEDLIIIAFKCGHAAGRLGLDAAMPRFTPVEMPRMSDAG